MAPHVRWSEASPKPLNSATHFLLVSGVLGFAFLALWGWGWLACRLTRQRALSAPLTATVGLGLVIFLGGCLCLTRVAFGRSFDAVALFGLALTVLGWWKGRQPRPRLTWDAGLAALPLLVAAWFLIRHATPPAAFNLHDDLERYFSYPVRLLAEGTFTPNPLGYLGADTLGAAAFLQAFVVAHLPIEYIGSVDLVGGLLLCLSLAGFGLPPGRGAAAALASSVLLLAVNPQIVNISAVFGGVALIMATVFLAASETDADAARIAPLTGLCYAALIALKTTFGVFVGVHLLCTALAGFAMRRGSLRAALRTGGWMLGWLIPWIALHTPLYLAAGAAPPLPPTGAEATEALALFSTTGLYYGSSQALYTGLALLGVALAALYGFVAARNRALRPGALTAAMAAGATGGGVYFILVAGLGPLMYGGLTATRYAVPIVLGTLAALVRLPDLFASETGGRWCRFLAVAGSLIMVLLFLPSLGSRVRQLADTRVPLAYFANSTVGSRANFVGYNAEVLHGATRARLESIQSLVPPREPLAVWVTAPFLLDYRRNMIWQTDPYGIAMPWARWPADTQYFLLEAAGFAVRTDAEWNAMNLGAADRLMLRRVKAFREAVSRRARTENVIYRDHNYVLIRLDPP